MQPFTGDQCVRAAGGHQAEKLEFHPEGGGSRGGKNKLLLIIFLSGQSAAVHRIPF